MSRMRTIGLALLTGLTLLAPSAASADTYSRVDAPGDVVTVDHESDARVVDPSYAEGDILFSRVVHARRSVRMTMRYRELTIPSRTATHFFELLTNEHVRRHLSVIVGPGIYQGGPRWQGVALLWRREYRKVRCPHMRTSIDYDANIIRVVLPRRCMSWPRWVRVGMAVNTSNPKVQGVDGALDDGQVADFIRLGPRVFR
jgi:hypothetical protein